jgi:hypothetical protein
MIFEGCLMNIGKTDSLNRVFTYRIKKSIDSLLIDPTTLQPYNLQPTTYNLQPYNPTTYTTTMQLDIQACGNLARPTWTYNRPTVHGDRFSDLGRLLPSTFFYHFQIF